MTDPKKPAPGAEQVDDKDLDQAHGGFDLASLGEPTSISGGDQFIPGGDQFSLDQRQLIPGGDRYIPGGDQFDPTIT